MTPEGWREVEEVYQSAMDREPGARRVYLDEVCRDNPQLRQNVDSLLELNDSPGHRARLGAGESLPRDSDDLVKVVAHAESTPDCFRVPSEAARPIVV